MQKIAPMIFDEMPLRKDLKGTRDDTVPLVDRSLHHPVRQECKKQLENDKIKITAKDPEM